MQYAAIQILHNFYNFVQVLLQYNDKIAIDNS